MSSPTLMPRWTAESAWAGSTPYEAMPRAIAERDTAANLPVVVPSEASKTAYTALLATNLTETLTAPTASWQYGNYASGHVEAYAQKPKITDQEFLAWQIRHGDLLPVTRPPRAVDAIAELDRMLDRIMDYYSQGQPLSEIMLEEREAARG
jgi:hypothetical protein